MKVSSVLILFTAITLCAMLLVEGSPSNDGEVLNRQIRETRPSCKQDKDCKSSCSKQNKLGRCSSTNVCICVS